MSKSQTCRMATVTDRTNKQHAFWVLFLVLGSVISANAHAILLSSVPVAHAVVSEPTIAISLKFNSRIDAGRSRVSLIGPDSSEQKLELEGQKSPDTLTAQLQNLANGAYRLRWQVLAVDGHITRGEIPFRVQLPTR